MRVDLLIRGAELLEADAAKADGVRFDLATWIKPYTYFSLYERENYKPQLNCSTMACAMGLFCLSGAFEKEGLGYTRSSLTPIYDDRLGHRLLFGYSAAEALFEITYKEAERLFSPDAYHETTGADAELAVAARMRLLAAGGDIMPKFSEEVGEE